MNKKMDKKDGQFDSDNIRIDYDHLDVADIMDQIKKKTDAQPKDKSTDLPSDEDVQPDSSLNPSEFENNLSAPSKVKKILLKIMRPFSPIIKLLVLPVHQELRETVQTLDNTNKRLDLLSDFLNGALDEVKTNLNQFNSETNLRVDLAFDDLNRAKEYAKLLHNLSHNMVVEMTKLKIEEENLKIRIRILEKDFEHIKNREKVLESRISQ
ncbi:MAG: hypothetical protein MUP98_10335 [Candidatus Aminicenantes bacterium]|nr:hypothetical protein [Candidatus Aminicenantes bacterium]